MKMCQMSGYAVPGFEAGDPNCFGRSEYYIHITTSNDKEKPFYLKDAKTGITLLQFDIVVNAGGSASYTTAMVNGKEEVYHSKDINEEFRPERETNGYYYFYPSDDY